MKTESFAYFDDIRSAWQVTAGSLKYLLTCVVALKRENSAKKISGHMIHSEKDKLGAGAP